MDIDAVRSRLASREPVSRRAPRQAAVALILVPGDGGCEALFIRRARHPRDPWSGHIGLPGGRRDPADRSLYHTALREAAEEVGVCLGRGQLLGRLDDLCPRSFPGLLIRPFVFTLAARPRLTLSDEVAYTLWLPLTGLRAGAGHGWPAARGRRLRVPCYRLGRHLVWGLTYRILTGLLEPATVPG